MERTGECFRLEGTLGGPFSSEQASPKIRRCCSGFGPGKLPKDGEWLHSFSGKAGLTVKKVFLTSSVDLSFRFMTVVLCPPTVYHFKECGSLYLLTSSQVLVGCCSVPPSHQFFQAEQGQVPQPLLSGQVPQPLTVLVALCHCSSLLVPFLHHRTQNWTWYSRCSLTNWVKRGNNFP